MSGKGLVPAPEDTLPPLLLPRAVYISFTGAWLASMCMGVTLGYSSPASKSLLKLSSESEEDDTSAMIRPEDIFWFSSLMNLGAVFGCLFGASLAQAVGRKRTLFICALGYTVSWIELAYSGDIAFLYAGRLATGFFTGIASLVAPVYLSEVSPEASRGLHGGLTQLAITIGIFLSYLGGVFLDWSSLALFLVVPSAIMMPFVQMSVESPRWMILKRNQGGAMELMARLRPPDVPVDDECLVIEATFPNTPTPATHILVALHIMFLQQFSGINSIIFYARDVFVEAGVDISADSCAMLLAALQVAVTMAATSLLDVMGRRVMLITSSAICIVAMAAMGILDAFFIRSDSPEGSLPQKIEPMLVAVYILGFSVGLGPVTWITVCELVPCRGFGLTLGIVCAFNWTCSFTVTLFFENMQQSFKKSTFYFFFCAITSVGALLVVIFMPETSGISLEQILLEQLGGEDEVIPEQMPVSGRGRMHKSASRHRHARGYI